MSDLELENYYTSCDFTLLKLVYERAIAELRHRGSPALAPNAETETGHRLVKSIMDLAEAGIRDPAILERLAVQSVTRARH